MVARWTCINVKSCIDDRDILSSCEMGCITSSTTRAPDRSFSDLILHNYYVYQGQVMQIVALHPHIKTAMLQHPLSLSHGLGAITLDKFDDLVPCIEHRSSHPKKWVMGERCTLRWNANVYTGVVEDVRPTHLYIKYTDGLTVANAWVPVAGDCLHAFDPSHFRVVVNAPDTQTYPIGALIIVLHGWYWYGFRPIRVYAIEADMLKIAYMDTGTEYEHLARDKIVHHLEEYQPLACEQYNVAADVARIRGVECEVYVNDAWVRATVGQVTLHVFQLIMHDKIYWLPLKTSLVAPKGTHIPELGR